MVKSAFVASIEMGARVGYQATSQLFLLI